MRSDPTRREKTSAGPALLGVAFLALVFLACWPSLSLGQQEEPTPAASAPGLEEPASPDTETREIVPTRRIRGDRVAVGDSIRIPAGTTQDGNVVCIFGDVTIDGAVTGEVTVVGGSLRLMGSVRNNVVSIVSQAELGPSARIGGDLVSVGGLDDRGAEIRGGYTDVPLGIPFGEIGRPFSVLASLLLWFRLGGLVLFFVMILILAALFPERIRMLSDETPVRYFAAFFVGLAGYLGFVLLKILLISTLIGIPVIPFLLILFFVLTWLGRIAILHLVGTRLGRSFGREMSMLGAILLGLVPYALLLVVPLMIGGFAGIALHLLMSTIFWFLVDIPALGLILLTRAGGRSRKPGAPPPGAVMAAPTTARPPEPPEPPAGAGTISPD